MIKIKLKDYISMSGLKQKYIANQLGISESLFSLQIKGTRKIQENKIPKLCKLLGISENVYNQMV